MIYRPEEVVGCEECHVRIGFAAWMPSHLQKLDTFVTRKVMFCNTGCSEKFIQISVFWNNFWYMDNLNARSFIQTRHWTSWQGHKTSWYMDLTDTVLVGQSHDIYYL